MNIGDEVKVKESYDSEWRGMEGKVICKVFCIYHDGRKGKRRVEYIVQFSGDWSYFRRQDLRTI